MRPDHLLYPSSTETFRWLIVHISLHVKLSLSGFKPSEATPLDVLSLPAHVYSSYSAVNPTPSLRCISTKDRAAVLVLHTRLFREMIYVSQSRRSVDATTTTTMSICPKPPHPVNVSICTCIALYQQYLFHPTITEQPRPCRRCFCHISSTGLCCMHRYLLACTIRLSPADSSCFEPSTILFYGVFSMENSVRALSAQRSILAKLHLSSSLPPSNRNPASSCLDLSR